MGLKMRRLRTSLRAVPSRMVHGVRWAHVEPAGLGVGTAEAGDVEEREARRRHEREVWRADDEPASASSRRG